MKYYLLFTIFLMLQTNFSFSNSCLKLDKTKDNLSSTQQNAALLLMEDALETEGVTIVQKNCTQTYEFYNVKFGTNIKSVLRVGKKRASHDINNFNDLYNSYMQLARIVVKESTASAAINRKNITQDQMKNKRIPSESLYMLGLGYLLHANGPSFNFMYRNEIDEWAVGYGGKIGGGKSQPDFFFLFEIEALYYLSPYANHSVYAGVGAGLGAEFEKEKNIDYSGFGVEISGRLGYELLRSSTIRLFVQVDVHHPFYKLSHKDKTRHAFTRPSLVFGIGYTPRPSSRLFWFLPF